MIINHTKYLDFKKTTTLQGNDWYYVKRTNDTNFHDSAVVITTLIKKDEEYHFLFLKTKRPPLYAENKAEYCMESPAGLIGDDDITEDLISCAKKELLEEAGLVANEYHLELTNASASSGLSSETLSYVTAIVDNYQEIKKPVSDGGIIVDRFCVPAKSILNFIQNLDYKKMSVASATMCGIYFALKRIGL